MIGFENYALLVLILLVIPFVYKGLKADQRFKKILMATKSFTLIFLVLAAASPFIQHQDEISEEAEATVLVDDSRSSEILEKQSIEFEEIKTREKTIASGNNSDLNRGISRNIDENSAYLLISDLQSSTDLQPAIDKARNVNATINVVKPETKEESSVRIKGPDSTVPGAKNVFTVRKYSTENGKKPKLYLDGEAVDLNRRSNNTYTYETRFEEKGKHTLEAEIISSDRFEENNKFYKTVKVSEKPKILIIGDEGSLKTRLSEFYDLEYSDSVPNDLSSYYTVIAKQKFEEGELSDYVAEGNGLIYTGEIDSENSLLPVKSSDSDQESKGAKIMLAVDISTSTETDNSVKKEKQIAYSLAEKLPFNNKLGAVAYNEDAWLLSEPEPLATNRANLKTKISSLKTGGNSFHQKGIEAAGQKLDEEGNIILVTDGRISVYGENRNVREKSLRNARSLKPRLITVGVGENKNEEFLKDLADEGGGFYLDAAQSGRLNFMFEAGGAEDRVGRIVKVNSYHFITEGLPKLETRTAGYESVKPKKGSDLLVSSTSGKPFLTTWRYGLGRVAAFSSGSSDLGTASTTDPLLVTRTVSWATGQPERKKDEWIKIEDGRKPEKVEVRTSYQIEGLKRQGENLYTTELSPETTGFQSYEGRSFGYNYNSEIEEIGYNPENEIIASRTGGKVFSPDEKEDIKESIENFSKKEVKKKKPLSDYFLLAALIIFLGEVGYRKRKGKK